MIGAIVLLALLVLILGFILANALSRIRALEESILILNNWADYIDEHLDSEYITLNLEEELK
jgi:hypothetical protein